MKGRAMTNLGAQRALPTLLTTAGWVVAGSAILAASAQIALPIPLSPVPVTLQTFGLAMVVALLGTRLGTYAAIAYLAEGASGLPVFAQHQGGFIWLVGPSAGYLWSFPVAAFVLGWAFDAGLWRSAPARFVALVAATAIVFLAGAGWLARYVGGGAPAFAAGVLPFVFGDVLKCAVATVAAPLVRRFGPARR
jgi:biotin transport system substrate-specific component